jgi:hypothetical protein
MLGFKRFETAAVTILGPWSRPLNICEAFSPEKNMYLIIFGAREPFCVHRIRIAPEHSFRSCREPNIKVFADRAPECLQIPDRPLKQALAIVEIQRPVLPKPLPKPRKVAIPNLLGMRMPERFCSVGNGLHVWFSKIEDTSFKTLECPGKKRNCKKS